MLRFKAPEEFENLILKVLNEFDLPCVLTNLGDRLFREQKESHSFERDGHEINISYHCFHDLGVIPDATFRLKTKNADVFIDYCDESGILLVGKKKNASDADYLIGKMEKVIGNPIVILKKVKSKGITLYFRTEERFVIDKKEDTWKITSPFELTIEAKDKKTFEKKLKEAILTAYETYGYLDDPRKNYNEIQHFLEKSLDEEYHHIYYNWTNRPDY